MKYILTTITILLFLTISSNVSAYQSINFNYDNQQAGVLSSLFNLFTNTSNAQTPDITTGLVGHWTFDEGAGTMAGDSSGSGNDGELTNMDPATDWVAGNIDGALSFDGTDDYVDFTDITSGTAHSFFMWANGSTNSISQGILGDGSFNGGFVYRADIGDLTYYNNDTQSVSIDFEDLISKSGQWAHIGVVRQDTSVTFYLNGQSYDDDGKTLGSNAITTIGRIGWNKSAYNNFNGLIDDVRIYSRALTQSDITELYNYTGGGGQTCGNSIAEGAEQCDTGGSNGACPATCSSSCTTNSCTADTTSPNLSSPSPTTPLPSGTTQTTLSLTTDGTGGPDICKYSITADTQYSAMTVFNTTNSTSHSILILDLSDGNSYTYYIRCQDIALNQNTSDYTISFSVDNPSAPDTQAPSIPTNLSATPISSSQMNLTWTASTDDTAVAGYNIYRCTGTSCTPIFLTTSSNSSYSDANLSPLTQYTYTVSAYDAVGNVSAQTEDVSVTTLVQTVGNTYEVGPGQALTSLGEVPWLMLGEGDVVRIHWRAESYKEKIGLRGRGTESNPIHIVGIPNANGDLPVIDGHNATTDIQFDGFFNQQWDVGLGLIVIKRSSNDPWGYKPGHIIIENLKIIGGHSPNAYTGAIGSFTNAQGVVTDYFDGAAAIWAILVEHLTIRGCEITDNGNGIFVLSKNNNEEETSRNILIDGNYVHGNGNVGRYREHNIYTQVAGIVFQNNRIGRLRDGALGSTLKDRSSGTVIRYNWIESSARTLDLVEAEDSWQILTLEPDYHTVFVYGNYIVNDTTKAVHSANMIHFGGDQGVTLEHAYRNGPLYFYNNTVVIKSNKSDAWRVRLFDLEADVATAELWNNIIYREGDSNFYLLEGPGTLKVHDVNWISSDYQPFYRSGIVEVLSPFTNIVSGLSDSLFENINASDFYASDFYLSEISSALDAAGVLPSVITTNHDASNMYELHQKSVPRIMVGSGMDLGAFEGMSIGTPLPDTTAPTTILTPTGGTYSSTQSITLSTEAGATTYYTIDNTTPSTSSTIYTTPILISQDTTLQFFSVDTEGDTEGVKTEIYTILTADFNSDGFVNTIDWSILNTAWGTNNPALDLDNNNIINALDWSVMNAQWSS